MIVFVLYQPVYSRSTRVHTWRKAVWLRSIESFFSCEEFDRKGQIYLQYHEIIWKEFDSYWNKKLIWSNVNQFGIESENFLSYHSNRVGLLHEKTAVNFHQDKTLHLSFVMDWKLIFERIKNYFCSFVQV